ncbi:hypothetical protein BEH94_04610 [Candidatus Altiarchaeales archaeon WOR_SM1_SCG]|nr:hypothetical protein BEH94_04610 [Candidatus Altiarchaeales archaeon WOR_SM1_SCG]
MKQNYIKIIMSEKHNLEKIKSIIARKNPETLIIESSSWQFNFKAQYLTQKLISAGWHDAKVKLSYKGNLFKVILSKKPKLKDDCPGDVQDTEGFYDPKAFRV